MFGYLVDRMKESVQVYCGKYTFVFFVITNQFVSCDSCCSVALPHGAVVCDCGFS